jgi:hypothetical protein
MTSIAPKIEALLSMNDGTKRVCLAWKGGCFGEKLGSYLAIINIVLIKNMPVLVPFCWKIVLLSQHWWWHNRCCFLEKYILFWSLLSQFSNKYPLQRDIFCINEASLLCVPFGPLRSFAPWLGGFWIDLNWLVVAKEVPFGLVLGLYSAQLFVTMLLHASLRSTKVVLFTPHINVLRSYFVCLHV